MAEKIRDRRSAIIAAVVMILLLRPYFTWSFIENSFVKLFLFLVLSLLFFSRKRKTNNKEQLAIIVFLLATFCYVSFGLLLGRMNFSGFFSNLTQFLLIFVAFSNKQFGQRVFDSFSTLFSVLLGVSMASWIIYQTIGLPQLGTLELIGQHRHYLHYPFFVIENLDYTQLDFLRFYGPFDEPGVVGTYGALVLAISRYNFKDWRIVIIFISGLFSFSLFFYIVSFIYLLYYYIVVKKKVIVSALLAIALAGFYFGTQNNPVFYEYIWKRTEWNEGEKRIQGDNRSNAAVDAYLERVRGTSEYYVGTSDSDWYNSVAGGESSTYKSIICVNGIIFFVLYVGFFLLLGTINKSKKSELILYCLIVLANFYQRASIFFPVAFFLYSAFAMDYYVFKTKTRREKGYSTAHMII